jgi:uncharacterized phage protein gp47/JayE
MIDPGHPFTVKMETLIASLETSLREGVEQSAGMTFVYQQGASHALPSTATDVIRVSGRAGSQFRVFEPGLDYEVSNRRVMWRTEPSANGRRHEPLHPDDKTRIEVEYTYREPPSGLTDFGPGTVAGTLLRAVAREFALLYGQMDEAYRRAFIDVAAGVGLDNVVALLGLSRKAPTRATGEVTFFRKSAGSGNKIGKGTRIADSGGRLFATTEDGVIEAEPRSQTVVPTGRVMRVDGRVADLVGVFRTDDKKRESPLPAEQSFGEDTRTITLLGEPPPGGSSSPGSTGGRPGPRALVVVYRPASVQVPVEAVEPGPRGNADAGSLVVMPTPPPGIDGVVNEDPVTGGQDPESDDQLRDRARHALERAGNATLDALRFAVLEVDGVEGVEVVDHRQDESIPLGEVRVHYSMSADDPGQRAKIGAAVMDTIDRSRAAGVIVHTSQTTTGVVSGTFYVIPEPVVPETAPEAFRAAVVASMSALRIGEALSIRRLNAAAYAVGGIADVAEAHLFIDGSDKKIGDPQVVGPTEQLRPGQVEVKLLTKLAIISAKATGKGGKNAELELEVQLLAGSEPPAAFDGLSFDVAVSLKGRSVKSPKEPGVRLSDSESITKLEFASAPSATLRIDSKDLGYRPDDHLPEVEVVVRPAIYEGVGRATAIVVLPT